MPATYTFDVFASLDGYGVLRAGRRLGRLLGQARPRAARAPTRPVQRLSSAWSSGPTPSGTLRRCCPRAQTSSRWVRTWATRMMKLPGHGGVIDAGRPARLAERDCGER